jgi:hypothetical protein
MPVAKVLVIAKSAAVAMSPGVPIRRAGLPAAMCSN